MQIYIHFQLPLDKSFHSYLHLQLFSSAVFYNVLFLLGTLLFRPTSQSPFFCSSQPLSKTNANFSLALSQTQAQAQVTVSSIDSNRSNISIPNPLRFLILKIQSERKKQQKVCSLDDVAEHPLRRKSVPASHSWELREAFKAHAKRKHGMFSIEFQLPHNLDYTLVTCG